MEIAGEPATDGKRSSGCQRERPDVVLMDIRMPHVDASRDAPGCWPGAVVILTTYELDEYVFDRLRGRVCLPPEAAPPEDP